MLTADGYVKLVDFGFAKQIGYSAKTWTFCGTPGKRANKEYHTQLRNLSREGLDEDEISLAKSQFFVTLLHFH
jgi:serine/threonine protein kinase